MREIVLVNPPSERIAPGYVIERVVASAPCDRARLLRFALGCARAERRSVAASRPSLLVPRAESPN